MATNPAVELKRLSARFASQGSAPAPLAPGASAVLFLLVPAPDGLQVLFTLRSDHLSQHPGEVSFPGGRIEPSDADALDAALRETEEEIGLPASAIHVLGHLVNYVTFRGETVGAYVGTAAASRVETLGPVSQEVESVLLVPLASLLAPPRKQAPTAAPKRGGPQRCDVLAYESRRWEEGLGGPRTIHYWKLSNGRTLWGITGDLAARFLEDAYGWVPPEAPRRIERPDEVRP